MKTRVVKFNVLAEVINDSISSATDLTNQDLPKILSEMYDSIDNIAHNLGFKRLGRTPDQFSCINGGYSIYCTYVLSDGDKCIRLILDMRISNHPSQPNISHRNDIRKKIVKDQDVPYVKEHYRHADSIDVEVMDNYYKSFDSGYIQIYVGDSKYCDPVDSIESMNRIVEGKLSKLVKNISEGTI